MMEILNSLPLHWLWLGLTIVFVLVELGTTALVSIWFVAGSLAALITAFITPSFITQLLVFAVVSALALAVTRPLVRRVRTARTTATGADRNIGRTASVLEPIQPGIPGRVRLDGVDWIASADTELLPGELCTVLQIHGTTLNVAPMQQTPPEE